MGWLNRLHERRGVESAGGGQVDEWMREAYRLHNAGELAQAEELYRRILAEQPQNPDALYLRGELARRTGRIDAAIEWIGRAAALDPEVALFHLELGALHEAAGEHARARDAYARVLELEPHNLDALVGLGLALLALGEPEAAAARLRAAVELDPASVAARVNLGSALQSARRFDEAEASYREALRLDPQCVPALANLGSLRIKKGEYAEAQRLLEGALGLDPLFTEARMNLGIVLLKQDRGAEALRIFEDAVRARPDMALAHYYLGRIYRRAGNLERAIASYREAIALAPGAAEFHVDLARALIERGEPREAAERCREAIARNPRLAAAHLRLGYALEATGDFGEALACYERAIALEPESVQGHVNRAALRLLLGEYARGWEEYEWRLRDPSASRLHGRFPAPLWEGSPLQGRTILAYAEQGIGDEIMYAACLPELIERSARVLLHCEPRLEALFRRSFPRAIVHGGAQGADARWLREAPAPDFKVPLASLPHRLRRTVPPFAPPGGYLKAAPERIEAWRARLAGLGAGLKVGLAWRGGVPKTGRALRSLALEQLLPALRTPGIAFVSLQYGECRAELADLRQRHGVAIRHWQEAIDDFDECAALVSALDLVVSVCTAVVHLGGALGRPVWVMAPVKPEARYGLRGEAMPWYPSVRMFRQAAFGDWEGVVARVARSLGELAR